MKKKKKKIDGRFSLLGTSFSVYIHQQQYMSLHIGLGANLKARLISFYYCKITQKIRSKMNSLEYDKKKK